MGVGYIDYLIGDKTIIPQNQREFYSENIVYLPNSFLPPDHRRHISDKRFSRAEAGLPDNGFVFCSFNNHYKISPGVFELVDAHTDPRGRQRALASRDQCDGRKEPPKGSGCAGVSSERLVFAGRMPPADHLARHHLADLFVDTLPYNAHTTASEALWTGLPVITRSGETFAGRVAASLLNAI